MSDTGRFQNPDDPASWVGGSKRELWKSSRELTYTQYVAFRGGPPDGVASLTAPHSLGPAVIQYLNPEFEPADYDGSMASIPHIIQVWVSSEVAPDLDATKKTWRVRLTPGSRVRYFAPEGRWMDDH